MISVIIPVYNAGPYLARCLDSVLNSTYHDFELILINDGSTDSSFEICTSPVVPRGGSLISGVSGTAGAAGGVFLLIRILAGIPAVRGIVGLV